MTTFISNQWLEIAIFLVFIAVMLWIDLAVLNRNPHKISTKEALKWSALWIGLALLFNIGVYLIHGSQAAMEFFTGYVIEESLSVDNLFVFIMIFTYFGVRPEYQHKVLFWGILGAVIMRFIFITAGITLIHRFHWLIPVFGVFLIFTGIKIGFKKDSEVHPEKNPLIKIVKKLFRMTPEYHGSKFFVKIDKHYFATPLIIVLLVVETTDVIFALDSIPAVLAITLDPFIVFSSNIMAILGLRSLYFALAGIMQLFRFLSYGLSVILVFVGVKMILADYYKIPIGIALSVVGGVLLLSIIASILIKPKQKENVQAPADADKVKPE